MLALPLMHYGTWEELRTSGPQFPHYLSERVTLESREAHFSSDVLEFSLAACHLLEQRAACEEFHQVPYFTPPISRSLKTSS